jgi:ABC-type nitrate/sulfonate/bicarbonate transport system permease component
MMTAQMVAKQRIEQFEIPRSTMFKSSVLSKTRVIQVSTLVVIIAVWQIVGERVGSFILAPPTAVISAAYESTMSGEIWSALSSSLYGILIGFAIAAVVGVTIGLLMGVSKNVATSLNPVVSAGYVIPEAAIIPLLIIWFGLGVTPRIISVVLFAVFEIIVATFAGVKNIDPMLPDVARSFGARRTEIFRKVILMAALPYVFAGLRMGAARAVKGMIVAELLFAATGVGGAIQLAANGYRTDKVMVFVIIITVIGVAFAGLVQVIERAHMRKWQQNY